MYKIKNATIFTIESTKKEASLLLKKTFMTTTLSKSMYLCGPEHWLFSLS
jgi:hypothetical protein